MPKTSQTKPKKATSPQKAAPSKRDRRNRLIAIWIILSLILSFLVGALSITPAPVAAAEIKSVQVLTEDQPASGTFFDTDGDGLENKVDPDIDGDGIVNAEDPDIDGDGKANFDDGDPAATNGFDSNPPIKTTENPLEQLTEVGVSWGLWLPVSAAVIGVFVGVWLLRKNRKNR